MLGPSIESCYSLINASCFCCEILDANLWLWCLMYIVFYCRQGSWNPSILMPKGILWSWFYIRIMSTSTIFIIRQVVYKQGDIDIYFFIPLQEIIHHSNFNCPSNSTTKQDIQSYSWPSMSITSGHWQPPKRQWLLIQNTKIFPVKILQIESLINNHLL